MRDLTMAALQADPRSLCSPPSRDLQQREIFPFFDLPRELRDWVYDHLVLSTPTLAVPATAAASTLPSARATAVNNNHHGHHHHHNNHNNSMNNASASASTLTLPTTTGPPFPDPQTITLALRAPTSPLYTLISHQFAHEYTLRLRHQTTLLFLDHRDFQFAPYAPLHAASRCFAQNICANVRRVEVCMFATCARFCGDREEECDLVRLRGFMEGTFGSGGGGGGGGEMSALDGKGNGLGSVREVVLRIGIWGGRGEGVVVDDEEGEEEEEIDDDADGEETEEEEEEEEGGNANAVALATTTSLSTAAVAGSSSASSSSASASSSSVVSTTDPTTNQFSSIHDPNNPPFPPLRRQHRHRRHRRRPQRPQPPAWPASAHGADLEAVLANAGLTHNLARKIPQLTRLEIYRCEREWDSFDVAFRERRLAAVWRPLPVRQGTKGGRGEGDGGSDVGREGEGDGTEVDGVWTPVMRRRKMSKKEGKKSRKGKERKVEEEVEEEEEDLIVLHGQEVEIDENVQEEEDDGEIEDEAEVSQTVHAATQTLLDLQRLLNQIQQQQQQPWPTGPAPSVDQPGPSTASSASVSQLTFDRVAFNRLAEAADGFDVSETDQALQPQTQSYLLRQQDRMIGPPVLHLNNFTTSAFSPSASSSLPSSSIYSAHNANVSPPPPPYTALPTANSSNRMNILTMTPTTPATAIPTSWASVPLVSSPLRQPTPDYYTSSFAYATPAPAPDTPPSPSLSSSSSHEELYEIPVPSHDTTTATNHNNNNIANTGYFHLILPDHNNRYHAHHIPSPPLPPASGSGNEDDDTASLSSENIPSTFSLPSTPQTEPASPFSSAASSAAGAAAVSPATTATTTLGVRADSEGNAGHHGGDLREEGEGDVWGMMLSSGADGGMGC